MKTTLKTSIITFFLTTMAFATVTVDGYAYLENQTQHDSIQVYFEMVAPNDSTYTVYTDNSGYYSVEVAGGIYDVTYSKNEYFTVWVDEQNLFSSTSLSDLTLLESISLIDGHAYLENQTQHDSIQVYFEMVAPNDSTYTVYTDNSGYYSVEVAGGIYDVTYSKNEYFTVWVDEQNLFSSTSLSDLTLLEATSLINVPSQVASIQAAIDNAFEGDTVLVDTGTYYENINFNGKNITVASLYLTNQDSSYISQTVIDGNSSGTVVKFSNGEDATAILSGFTIQNGYMPGDHPNYYGGGIYCRSSSPSLENVTITNNSAGLLGGGIFCQESSPSLENVTISNNSASSGGGGIFFQESSPTLTNVTITNNSSEEYGGGIVCYLSSPSLENVTISNNSAGLYGGGIFCQESSPNILNTIVSGNEGNYGIYVYAGDPSIKYSNFYNNENGDFYNCNQYIGMIITTNANGDSCDAFYNIQENPLFVDATNGDYNLQQGSPCIDAGDPDEAFYDPDGSVADMGAFYFDTAPFTPTADFSVNTLSGDPPLVVSFTNLSQICDVGTPIESWDWDFGDGNTSNEQNPTHTFQDNGIYTISLTITDTLRFSDSEIKEDYINVTATEIHNLDIGGDEDLQHLITHTPLITFDYNNSESENQTQYHIQVSTDSTFSSANMWDAGSVSSDTTSVTYAGAALVDGTTYYLRVRVASGDFWSDWSTLTFRMNTEPTTPVLVAPINDQVSGTPVVLNVLNGSDAESDAVTYSFNVFSDVTLITKLDSATAVTEGTDTTSWQITATLPDNGQYFWIVSTNDGYEESTVSTATSFLLNISNDAPVVFALLSPADSAEVTTLTPLLDWASASDPDPIDTVRYTLYLDTPEPGVTIVNVDTATSYQISNPFSDNTTYYWKVIATDLSGVTTENTGGYHSFRVNTENDLPGDFALLSPEDVSMVTDLTPTFHWEEPTDADDGRTSSGMNDLLSDVRSNTRTNSRSITSYNVFISIDSIFSGVIPDTVLTNSYTHASDLNEDMVYYWKVVAVDNDGGTTESSIWSFWTNSENSAPTAITLLTPTADEDTGLTPTFSWTASSDTDLYDVIGYTLSYGSDQSSLTDVSTNSELTYTPETDLTDNTDYVWQVTATDQSGATYTAALQSFTVNNANDDPGIFSLVSPDSGSVITDSDILLFWDTTVDSDGDPLSYALYFGNDPVALDAIDTLNVNYYEAVGLNEGSHYWKVTAFDGLGGSTTTATWSFLINAENSAPDEFALLTPEDDDELTTLTPIFTWDTTTDSDIGDQISYTLELGESFDSLSVAYSGSDTTFTSAVLSDNTTYYWKVIATDLSGATTENSGGYHSFRVNTENDPPSVFSLVTPTDNSIEVDLSPFFYWIKAVDPDPLDMVSYHLFIDQDQTFTSTVAIEIDYNGFNYDILNTILDDNSGYYWKVNALDNHDAVTGSDTLQFWTDAFPEPPLAFNTISPVDSTEALPTEVSFVWNNTEDPDPIDNVSFTLVYATDWADSNTFEYVQSDGDTTASATLINDTEYFWWVMANDEDELSTQSNDGEVNRFVVGTLAVDPNGLIPEVFALHQNYPNPFNPVTTLHYDLPEQSHVEIMIYDIMGREVRRLVNQTQDAGYKSVIWDGTNEWGQPMSAGLYFYRISAGDFHSVKKMVLLK